MALPVYGVEINESDSLPEETNFHLNLVAPLPSGTEVEIDCMDIKFLTPGLWVIQLGFDDSNHEWLTINWMDGALPTFVEPHQITITHRVVEGSRNKYPFSASFMLNNQTYLFDPTIVDCPPG